MKTCIITYPIFKTKMDIKKSIKMLLSLVIIMIFNIK